MIKAKQKKCKGTGKAQGFGCGQTTYKRTYGLCDSCLKEWAYNTESGHEYLAKTSLRKVRKEKKEKNKKKYVKWTDKPLNEMIQHVQFRIVNPYIRKRDEVNFGRCISSNNAIVDAGHYYPTTESKLRFCIANIHGQNHSDNRYKGGRPQAYKQGLIERHGQKYFDALERLKKESVDWPKIDRIELIKIGKTYEYLMKLGIWCFEHQEFENYKNIINK